MVKVELNYPIGTQGQPWGDAEKKQWLESRVDHCIHQIDVVKPLFDMYRYNEKLTPMFKGLRLLNYGTLTPEKEGQEGLPLWAVMPTSFTSTAETYGITDRELSDAEIAEAKSKPTVLITGGTHGYEKSGVMGALRFLSSGKAEKYSQFFNIVVVPCVSPWGYEKNERWTAAAIDPNRSFGRASPSSPEPLRTEESTKLMAFLDGLGIGRDGSDRDVIKWLCHIDLHETTDSDCQEFRPAKAARDGLTEYDNHIPDGFYLVGDSVNSQSEWYNAILNAVEGATHIAEMESDNTISGYSATSRGLIEVPCKELGLCAGGAIPKAKYVATTEVYPDSDRTTEEDCINAQVEAICAAHDFILKKGVTLL